jgi:1-acyl-sn-glycerol-3-phosphate acyltransferase
MDVVVSPISSNKFLRHVMACVKLLVFLISTAVLVVLHAVFHTLFKTKLFLFLFHRFNCFLFGLHVNWQLKTNGVVEKINFKDLHTWQSGNKKVFLGNHVSYLDILVLGARLEACFVAKADVERWPLFGFLAKLQNTLFISRRAKDFEQVRKSIAQRLSGKDSLIIFPEGTSSNGVDVLPLKSSLFSLFVTEAGNKSLFELVAFAVKLEKVEGCSVSQCPDLRDFYAWYGDMTLLPHLWALAHLRSVDVTVTLDILDEDILNLSRKELSVELRKRISSCL